VGREVFQNVANFWYLTKTFPET